MAGSMSGREARAGDSRHSILRIAGGEAAESRAPVATVAERPEARSRSEVDPMFSVALRAFLLDLGILGTSISLYIAVMINANYLIDSVATPLTGAGMVVSWLFLILLRGGYEARYLGAGNEEFKRVVNAGATMLSVIAIGSYVAKSAPPLRLVLPSLLIGTMLVLLGRWLLRIWLGRQRLEGRFQQSTLIVGDRLRSAALSESFATDAVAGFKVIGTVQPPRVAASDARLDARDHVVDAWLDDVMDWIDAHNVHAVAVAESTAVDPALLRRLAWRLEGPRIDLLVSPVLSDVAGPRMSVRPAAGLPLIHLDEPNLTGPKRALKRIVDLLVAVPLVIIVFPVYLLTAAAIKFDSLGKALYISDRIGRSGEVFRCIKFRTMHIGADSIRADVIGDLDDEVADRYREDPRVTRVGRVLRRWSMDELPQLFNVISGSMSLVGPRPMLPGELELLGDAEHRRHLTKPGMTGLWQISGRKEVSWDDRMRMDLHYIETWSIALDIVILAKTGKAVITGHGAY
jgi:exopolysaccharide biosynthesis polyprenyl glycosylphosphotransferase